MECEEPKNAEEQKEYDNITIDRSKDSTSKTKALTKKTEGKTGLTSDLNRVCLSP